MDLVPSAAYDSLLDPGGGGGSNRGRSLSGDRVVILHRRNGQEQDYVIPQSAMQQYLEEKRRRSQEEQETSWQESVFAASSRYSTDGYQPANTTTPATTTAPATAANTSSAPRYPGLELEQRKMHLAGDYYRSQANSLQQQQLLEKPADQLLAHEHYLGNQRLPVPPVVRPPMASTVAAVAPQPQAPHIDLTRVYQQAVQQNRVTRSFSQHWIVVGKHLRVLLLDFDGKFNLLIPNIDVGKAFRINRADVEVQTKALEGGHKLTFMKFIFVSPSLEIKAPVLNDKAVGYQVLQQNGACVFLSRIFELPPSVQQPSAPLPTATGARPRFSSPQPLPYPQAGATQLPGGVMAAAAVETSSPLQTALLAHQGQRVGQNRAPPPPTLLAPPPLLDPRSHQAAPSSSSSYQHHHQLMEVKTGAMQACTAATADASLHQQHQLLLTQQQQTVGHFASSMTVLEQTPPPATASCNSNAVGALPPISSFKSSSSTLSSSSSKEGVPGRSANAALGLPPETADSVINFFFDLYSELGKENYAKMTTCTYCGRRFRIVSVLLAHLRCHVGDSVEKVVEMKMKIWVKRGSLRCQRTGCASTKLKYAYTLDYVQHRDSHAYAGLACDVCGLAQASPAAYAVHLGEQHKSYLCLTETQAEDIPPEMGVAAPAPQQTKIFPAAAVGDVLSPSPTAPVNSCISDGSSAAMPTAVGSPQEMYHQPAGSVGANHLHMAVDNVKTPQSAPPVLTAFSPMPPSPLHHHQPMSAPSIYNNGSGGGDDGCLDFGSGENGSEQQLGSGSMPSMPCLVGVDDAREEEADVGGVMTPQNPPAPDIVSQQQQQTESEDIMDILKDIEALEHNPPEPSPVTNHPSDAQMMAELDSVLKEKQSRDSYKSFDHKPVYSTSPGPHPALLSPRYPGGLQLDSSSPYGHHHQNEPPGSYVDGGGYMGSTTDSVYGEVASGGQEAFNGSGAGGAAMAGFEEGGGAYAEGAESSDGAYTEVAKGGGGGGNSAYTEAKSPFRHQELGREQSGGEVPGSSICQSPGVIRRLSDVTTEQQLATAETYTNPGGVNGVGSAGSLRTTATALGADQQQELYTVQQQPAVCASSTRWRNPTQPSSQEVRTIVARRILERRSRSSSGDSVRSSVDSSCSSSSLSRQGRHSSEPDIQRHLSASRSTKLLPQLPNYLPSTNSGSFDNSCRYLPPGTFSKDRGFATTSPQQHDFASSPPPSVIQPAVAGHSSPDGLLPATRAETDGGGGAAVSHETKKSIYASASSAETTTNSVLNASQSSVNNGSLYHPQPPAGQQFSDSPQIETVAALYASPGHQASGPQSPPALESLPHRSPCAPSTVDAQSVSDTISSPLDTTVAAHTPLTNAGRNPPYQPPHLASSREGALVNSPPAGDHDSAAASDVFVFDDANCGGGGVPLGAVEAKNNLAIGHSSADNCGPRVSTVSGSSSAPAGNQRREQVETELFHCDMCGSSFKSKAAIASHVTHCVSHRCDVCGRAFKSAALRHAHSLTCRPVFLARKSAPPPVDRSTPPKTTAETVLTTPSPPMSVQPESPFAIGSKCPSCSQRFLSRSNLEIHAKTCSPPPPLKKSESLRPNAEEAGQQEEEEAQQESVTPTNSTVTPIKSWLRKHIMDTVRPEEDHSSNSICSNSSSINSSSSNSSSSNSSSSNNSTSNPMRKKPVYIIPQEPEERPEEEPTSSSEDEDSPKRPKKSPKWRGRSLFSKSTEDSPTLEPPAVKAIEETNCLKLRISPQPQQQQQLSSHVFDFEPLLESRAASREEMQERLAAAKKRGRPLGSKNRAKKAARGSQEQQQQHGPAEKKEAFIRSGLLVSKDDKSEKNNKNRYLQPMPAAAASLPPPQPATTAAPSNTHHPHQPSLSFALAKLGPKLNDLTRKVGSAYSNDGGGGDSSSPPPPLVTPRRLSESSSSAASSKQSSRRSSVERSSSPPPEVMICSPPSPPTPVTIEEDDDDEVSVIGVKPGPKKLETTPPSALRSNIQRQNRIANAREWSEESSERVSGPETSPAGFKPHRRGRNTSTASDSGSSSITETPAKSKSPRRQRMISDAADTVDIIDEANTAAAVPPLPILKLKIPRAYLLPLHKKEAENTAVILPDSPYKRVAVRPELQRPRTTCAAPGALSNPLAQKLRSLNCKVDLQKFRFKMQSDVGCGHADNQDQNPCVLLHNLDIDLLQRTSTASTAHARLNSCPAPPTNASPTIEPASERPPIAPIKIKLKMSSGRERAGGSTANGVSPKRTDGQRLSALLAEIVREAPPPSSPPTKFSACLDWLPAEIKQRGNKGGETVKESDGKSLAESVASITQFYAQEFCQLLIEEVAAAAFAETRGVDRPDEKQQHWCDEETIIKEGQMCGDISDTIASEVIIDDDHEVSEKSSFCQESGDLDDGCPGLFLDSGDLVLRQNRVDTVSDLEVPAPPMAAMAATEPVSTLADQISGPAKVQEGSSNQIVVKIARSRMTTSHSRTRRRESGLRKEEPQERALKVVLSPAKLQEGRWSEKLDRGLVQTKLKKKPLAVGQSRGIPPGAALRRRPSIAKRRRLRRASGRSALKKNRAEKTEAAVPEKISYVTVLKMHEIVSMKPVGALSTVPEARPGYGGHAQTVEVPVGKMRENRLAKIRQNMLADDDAICTAPGEGPVNVDKPAICIVKHCDTVAPEQKQPALPQVDSGGLPELEDEFIQDLPIVLPVQPPMGPTPSESISTERRDKKTPCPESVKSKKKKKKTAKKEHRTLPPRSEEKPVLARSRAELILSKIPPPLPAMVAAIPPPCAAKITAVRRNSSSSSAKSREHWVTTSSGGGDSAGTPPPIGFVAKKSRPDETVSFTLPDGGFLAHKEVVPVSASPLYCQVDELFGQYFSVPVIDDHSAVEEGRSMVADLLDALIEAVIARPESRSAESRQSSANDNAAQVERSGGESCDAESGKVIAADSHDVTAERSSCPDMEPSMEQLVLSGGSPRRRRRQQSAASLSESCSGGEEAAQQHHHNNSSSNSRRNRIKHTGLNGGYWDVIGVRGVVREKLEKQESLERVEGGGNADPPAPPATTVKRRKLSKSDSTESSIASDASRGRHGEPAVAKRKLTKSDSLDSNMSCSSTDSGTALWMEEEVLLPGVKARQAQHRKRGISSPANAAKRHKAELRDGDQRTIMLPLRFQYDFDANNDSDYEPPKVGDTCPPEDDVKGSGLERCKEESNSIREVSQAAVGKTPPAAAQVSSLPCCDSQGSQPFSQGSQPFSQGSQPFSQGSQPFSTTDTLSSQEGSVQTCLIDTAVSDLKISAASPNAEQVPHVAVDRLSLPAAVPDFPTSNPGVLSPSQADPAASAAAEIHTEVEEDLNASKDSDDVWAAFRLKDEILDLEDNTEIWANTMDIFKSMEDMFTSSETKETEEAKKPEAVPSDSQVLRRDSYSDGDLSSSENPESSKENHCGDVGSSSRSTGSSCKRKKTGAGNSGGKSGPPGERGNASRDPVKRSAGHPGEALPPGGNKANFAQRSSKQTTSSRTSLAKQILSGPQDHERFEACQKTTSSSSSRQERAKPPAASSNSKQLADDRCRPTGESSRRINSLKGGSSRPKQLPELPPAARTKTSSASQIPSNSLNKDKLLSFLDREYERELSKAHSRQHRK